MKLQPTIIALACACLLWTAPANADLVITAGDVTLPFSIDSQSGLFDVFIQSDRTEAPDLQDWQVVLTSADSSVLFTDASASLDHPYVLGGLGAFFVTDIRDGGRSLKGLDSGFLNSAPLDDGDGLMSIGFEIAGGTPAGQYMVNISSASNDTFLTGPAGDYSDLLVQAGTITILDELFPVRLSGFGQTYQQDFDGALGTDGASTGRPLPTGWFANVDGVRYESISQAFPATDIVPGTYNAGSAESSDRALATGNSDSQSQNSIEFISEIIGGKPGYAVRLTYDVEAWGGDATADDPGAVAFDVTLSTDEGNGFNEVAQLGKTSTGETLSPGPIDGNAPNNRMSFDSGIVEVILPHRSQVKLDFNARAQAANGGYLTGLDNVVFRVLAAGDTDADGTVDPYDIANILIAGKFAQGPSNATWAEGDFDLDDDVDPYDIVEILSALSQGDFPGEYASEAGNSEDSIPDVIIDPANGSVTIDYAGNDVSSIIIDSAAGIFNGVNAASWDTQSAFIADTDNQLSNSSLSITFAGVDALGDGIIGPGFDADFDFAADLTVNFLAAGTTALQQGDVVVVPEPATIFLLLFGTFFAAVLYRTR